MKIARMHWICFPRSMIQYPLRFQASSSAHAGIQSSWQTEIPSSLPGAKLECAIPPEFEGPGGIDRYAYSPEDFFLLAAMNCFVATFKVIAEKSKVSYSDLELKAQLTVDRASAAARALGEITAQYPSINGYHFLDRSADQAQLPPGTPIMKSIEIAVGLTCTSADQERVLRTLKKTSESCLVAHSIRTSVFFCWTLRLEG